MKQFRCNQHKVIVSIPNSKNEFESGKYHDQIEYCQSHHQKFPRCVFEAVKIK